MATSIARKDTTVQPPPRLSGDFGPDLVTIREWFWSFYNATVVASGLLDPAYQATAGTFDPNALPDPTNTTIAAAQNTANHAYQLGATVQGAASAAQDTADTALTEANAALARAILLVLDFTLDETNNIVLVTFTTPLANTNYRVIVTAQNFTGTPPVDAYVPIKVDRTVNDFSITFADAPGTGNSVSFTAMMVPSS